MPNLDTQQTEFRELGLRNVEILEPIRLWKNSDDIKANEIIVCVNMN